MDTHTTDTAALQQRIAELEQALAEAHQPPFAAFATTTPLGIAFCSSEGTLSYANAAFQHITGRTGALAGQHVTTFFEDDTALRITEEVLPTMIHAGFWEGSLHITSTPGSEQVCSVRMFRLPSDSTSDVHYGVLLQDTSERYRQDTSQKIFQVLAQNSPDGIAIASVDGIMQRANPAFHQMIGYGEELTGMPISAFIAEQPEALEHVKRGLLTHGYWKGVLRYQRKNGDYFMASVATTLIEDEQGRPLARAAIIRDTTEQTLAEQERIELQEQVILAQQAALRELSTPLIPLTDDLVVMPLIGSIDSNRAQQIIETLLEGASRLQSGTTIIDITGVSVVDTQVANALLRAAQAVRLLGARVVITGIRPEVAQTLVGLGVDLSSITTHSTLQSGIAYAMRRHS